MIKKLLKGIVFGVLILWGIYLYFLYAGNTATLWNRIIGHQLYTAIFFVSFVLLYMLNGGNKMFRFMMFIIILINLYIIGDVFFRNNIGLDSRQFITLFGLIILALAVTYITHRVRFIFMGIIGIGIVFVLLTGILPMYENIPNINDFIQSQKTKIVNQWAQEWTLLIKNALWTKEIPINEIQVSDIDLSQKTQISFVAKTKSDIKKVFINLGNGVFININPQSAVTLEQSGETTIMQILQGNIEYYLPKELSWAIQLIGKYKGKSVENVQDTIRWNMVNAFEQQKERFFINEIGGDMILNPAINKVISFFINTLYTISPKAYQDNLANYNNIQAYLGISTTQSTTQKMTGESLRSMIDDIMSQVKKWAEETKINKRLQQ